MISESVINEIQERTDIIEVISGYVPLRRAGRHFKALCPFHHEKTPSFVVSAERQSFHCFGCGVGGDVVSFVMRYERMEFPEAIRHLASRVGITVPDTSLSGDQSPSVTAQLLKVNELAASYYQENFWSDRGRVGRQYMVAQRHIQEATLKTFQVGVATEEWQGLLAYAQRQGFAPPLLAQAGLSVSGDGRQPRDLFRKRVIFPIRDARGRIIGFGGRSIDGSEPKYLNSPETLLYHKSKSLFGLHAAAQAIRADDRVVIVEGYLDQITLFQAGIQTVVASLGTALTSDQARLLRRYSKRVIMVYDGDQAGEAATLRGLSLLIEEGFHVMVASLPIGMDPDQFVLERGKEAFLSLIGEAPDLLDYKLRVLLNQYDLREPSQKGRIASEMLASIAKVPHPVERTEYVRRLADRLAAREEDLLAELRRQVPIARTSGTATSVTVGSSSVKQRTTSSHKAEQLLIRVLLEEPSLIATVRDQLLLGDLQHPTTRQLLESVMAMDAEGSVVTLSALRVRSAPSSECAQWVEDIAASQEEIVDRARCLEDCLRHIRRQRLQQRLNELAAALKDAGEQAVDQREVMEEYNRVLRLLGAV